MDVRRPGGFVDRLTGLVHLDVRLQEKSDAGNHRHSGKGAAHLCIRATEMSWCRELIEGTPQLRLDLSVFLLWRHFAFDPSVDVLEWRLLLGEFQEFLER